MPILPSIEELGLPDEFILAAKGGRGGRGNFSVGHDNKDRERGQMGQRREILLSLQTIAEIGLVGLPNAGKSSLLNAVSNANSKVGSYPFTTIRPWVGVLKDSSDIVRIADIPGLLPEAHKNKGLGHSFLKHILQSRILAYVIDFSRSDPLIDLQIL